MLTQWQRRRQEPDDAPAVATTAPAAGWHPERPKFRPLHLLRTWLFSALALLVAAGLLPGAEVNGLAGAMVAAAVIALLNAILPRSSPRCGFRSCSSSAS